MSTLLICVLVYAVLVCTCFLFSAPGQYTITEENLFNYVGQSIGLWEDMDRGALTQLEDTLFERMETANAPYGATAVYNRFGDLYLAYPGDADAADAACRRLAARLTAVLGDSVEGAGRWEVNEDNEEALRLTMELPRDGGAALAGEQLGKWQGTTGDGAATISLVRVSSSEGGATVGLLWNTVNDAQSARQDCPLRIGVIQWR